MIREEVTVKLKNSVNSRPAAMLVQVASRFASKVYVEADNKRMNAKSIMGMMALGLDTGEVVTITADGSDEEAAVKEIAAYLTQKAMS